jgi:hypothetical protein
MMRRRVGAWWIGLALRAPRPGTLRPNADRPITAARSTSYRASPNEVTSRSMVDRLRRNDFIYGVVVTPFDEVL